MALKNTQYDMIMREYYRKQLNQKHQQDACISHAYTIIPQLSEIDGQIASLSVEQGKKYLDGDHTALEDLKEQITALGERRSLLLREHDLPADYLELHFSCPDCQDTGFIGNEKCHCFKQAVIDLLYTQSNIRDILEKENFSHFCLDYYPENVINPATGLSARATIQKQKIECEEFIRHFDEQKDNFFFYGDTGVGKTFLAHCIAKELLESAHSVIYFSAFELFDLFSKTVFGQEDDISELQQMHSYIFDCDLLIIDDLGTELTNSFVSSQLFLCINERLTRKKSTIISTNLSMDTFRDTYSERVFSRISSSYNMRKLIGDDIRILKKISPIKP